MTANDIGTWPPTPPTPPPGPQAQKSAMERVIGVFFEPTATFEDIARVPGFIAPLVIIFLRTLVTAGVMSQKIDTEQMVRKQIAKSSRAADIPKEQLERQVEIGAKFAKYTFFFVPLFVPITMLVLAGIM